MRRNDVDKEQHLHVTFVQFIFACASITGSKSVAGSYGNLMKGSV